MRRAVFIISREQATAEFDELTTKLDATGEYTEPTAETFRHLAGVFHAALTRDPKEPPP